jgi:hypothetical protein
MTREAWIEQLNAENAASIEEIARREATVADQTRECDELLARLAQRRSQQQQTTGDFVVKEFPIERQYAPPEIFTRAQHDTIALAMSMERQRQADALGELRADFAALKGALADLAERVADLEAGSSGGNGGGYEG